MVLQFVALVVKIVVVVVVVDDDDDDDVLLICISMYVWVNVCEYDCVYFYF